MALKGFSSTRGEASLGAAALGSQAVPHQAMRSDDLLDSGPRSGTINIPAKGYVGKQDRDVVVARVSEKLGLGGVRA